MNDSRNGTSTQDQLINQIIHQGKASVSALIFTAYKDSLTKDAKQLRPEPGSRDDNSTNPKGRAHGSTLRPSKAKQSMPQPGEKQRIVYPPRHFNQCEINDLERGVTKP